MSQTKAHSVEFSDEEYELFTQWLADRKRVLLSQLETVKSLMDKMGSSGKAVIKENPQWALKCLKILRQNKRKMDSSEIVDLLINTDPYSANLSRVEVMRGVSSRLNQLVNRGQAKKEEIGSKMYYTYVKDKPDKGGK